MRSVVSMNDLEAALLRAGKRVARGADVLADVAAELGDVLRVHLPRARDRLARRRVELAVLRRLDQRDPVSDRRFLRPAEAVKQRRLHQERGKVAVVERERLAQCRERSLVVLELPPHHGEVEPERKPALAERERALEQAAGAAQVAGRHRLQGGLVRAYGLFVHAAPSIIRGWQHPLPPRMSPPCSSSRATAGSEAMPQARPRRSTGCSPQTRATFRR